MLHRPSVSIWISSLHSTPSALLHSLNLDFIFKFHPPLPCFTDLQSQSLISSGLSARCSSVLGGFVFGCHSGDAGFHLFGIRTFYRPLVCQGASRGASRWRKLEGGLKGARRGLKGAWRGLKGAWRGPWRWHEGSLKGVKGGRGLQGAWRGLPTPPLPSRTPSRPLKGTFEGGVLGIEPTPKPQTTRKSPSIFFPSVASWLSPGRSTRSISMQHVPLIKAL